MAAVMAIQTLLIRGYLPGEEAAAAGASRPPSESPRSELPRVDIAGGGNSRDRAVLPPFTSAAASEISVRGQALTRRRSCSGHDGTSSVPMEAARRASVRSHLLQFLEAW